jgi:copper chaperone CopZ
VETNFKKHTATVTFDAEKTNVEALTEALAEGNFPVKGEPEFLE